MTESRWMLSEDGDEEFGMAWNIKEVVGDKMIQIANFTDEDKCRHFLCAVRWMDTLGSGKMSLAADGITFGTTGVPRATKKRVTKPKVTRKTKTR